MTVLLTGATGFIGSRVLNRLVSAGENIRVLVRPATLARPEAAASLSRYAGVQIICAEFSDGDTIERAMQGVDVVFHLAWQWKRSVNAAAEGEEADPAVVEHNITAAGSLLAASGANSVRRFVFTSSVAVYGPPMVIRQFPIAETADILQGDYGELPFVKYYMAPKIAIEQMIRSYARQCGFEYVILRPSVVYGPDASFASRLVRRTLAAPRWTAPDGAPGKWQMVHVDDVAQAIVLAGNVPQARNLEFNIAGAEVTTEQEMKQMIWAAASDEWPANASAPKSALRFEGYEFPRYDITRASEILGYAPQVQLREGLKEMVAAVLAAPEATPPESKDAPITPPAASPSPRDSDAFDIRDFYDQRIESQFLGDYFEQSGFWNFGLRVTGAETPREACENLMQRLVSMMGEKRDAILDVACGNGATTAYLAAHLGPERITAVNFSSRQIARARERAPACRFTLMDATALGFGEASFDALICVEAAFHFHTRDEFLREAVRVLKPRGTLVLADAVLPPASQTQPRVNYVKDIVEYQTRCLQAGFSAATATDATSQCWAAFAADLSHYTRRKLRAGEITLRRFFEIMLWLRHLGPERYVLACCVK